jgi:hypothetical protein
MAPVDPRYIFPSISGHGFGIGYGNAAKGFPTNPNTYRSLPIYKYIRPINLGPKIIRRRKKCVAPSIRASN